MRIMPTQYDTNGSNGDWWYHKLTNPKLDGKEGLSVKKDGEPCKLLWNGHKITAMIDGNSDAHQIVEIRKV